MEEKNGIELYEWFDSLITKENFEWKLATSSGTITMGKPAGIFYPYTELPEHEEGITLITIDNRRG